MLDPPSDDPDNYYPEEDGSPYEGGGNSSSYERRWVANWDMEDLRINDFKLKSMQKGTQKESPVFYLNLLNLRF